MSGGLLLTLITFGLLAWSGIYISRNSRAFSANSLAGSGMRRLTLLYLPLMQVAFALCLLSLGVLARRAGGVSEKVFQSNAVIALMMLAILLVLATALAVAVQGFTLSERQKRRGDAEAAGRLASRGFFIVLVGAVSALITIFATLLLTSSAPGG